MFKSSKVQEFTGTVIKIKFLCAYDKFYCVYVLKIRVGFGVRFKGSRVQEFKGSRVQGFPAEEAACPAFSAVGTPLGSTRAHHKSLRKVQWYKSSRVQGFKGFPQKRRDSASLRKVQWFKSSRVQMFKSSIPHVRDKC